MRSDQWFFDLLLIVAVIQLFFVSFRVRTILENLLALKNDFEHFRRSVASEDQSE